MTAKELSKSWNSAVRNHEKFDVKTDITAGISPLVTPDMVGVGLNSSGWQ